jgi:hypothetical protein
MLFAVFRESIRESYEDKKYFLKKRDQLIDLMSKVVKGAADHPVQLTMVRVDSTRHSAVQADFTASRDRVAVPRRYWTPADRFDESTTASASDTAFTSYPVLGVGGTRVTRFKVSINRACALDTAEWTRIAGRVDAFNGWEAGPPHQAEVEVAWTPVCMHSSTNFVFAADKRQVCRIAFNLQAWALCPVGVAP